MKNRMTALLLATALLCTLLPAPVLAQSAGTADEALGAAFDANAYDWLADPLADETLRQTLPLTSQLAYREAKAARASLPRDDARGAAVSAFSVRPQSSGATSSDAFLISTAAQLAELAELVNAGNAAFNAAHYKLTADIDLSAYAPNTPLGGSDGWIPIGNSANPFKGVFDGQNKIVTGLSINRAADYQGLFGCVQGADSSQKAQVKNVVVKDASVRGGSYVGAVAGCFGSFTERLTGCVMEGGSVGGESFVGGVVGYVLSGLVERCYATGGVTATGDCVGGVVGKAVSVLCCYATGGVSGTRDYVGGVVGQANGVVSNCYATGSVSGADYVGGVAGEATNERVTDCAALGRAVNSTSTHINFGRVLGSGSILNCYAWSSMKVNDDTITDEAEKGADTKNGADLTYTSNTLSPQFSVIFTGGVDLWNKPFASNALPTLNNVGGTQSRALPWWIAGGVRTSITTAAELKALADFVNNGGDTSGKAYILENDIDLSA